MAKYLYMDGVDDRILIPSMTFNRVIINGMYTYRTSGAWSCVIGANGNATINTAGNFSVNGYLQPIIDGIGRWGFPYNNYKGELILTRNSTVTGISTIFSNNTNDYLQGELYDVKYFDDHILQAHYDMSTGTVLDQSGNGRHATLVGGTWMGEEEPPSGTAHALTSTINNYSDTIANVTVSKYHPLVSTVQSNSSATNVLNLSKRLSSTFQSNSSGLAYLRATKALLSTVNSVSSTQASLNVATVEGSEHALSSTIIAQSGTSATISTNRRLSTTIQSNAQLTGSLAVTTGMALFGVANVSTSTDGELNVSLSLNTSIMANTETFTTMLTNRGLTSEIHSQSQMNAILGINKPLSSIITVQSFTASYLGFGEQIIGYIYLNGYRQLDIHLRGKRELHVPLKGKRELEVHLKGGV